jgi:FtsZ-binding cell division protein ZapB
LEELRRKSSDLDANLQSKYHKALKQMEVFVKDNTQLKNDNASLRQEILQWRSKFEALERSSAR